VSNDKTLKVGDKVMHFQLEAEVLVPNIEPGYLTPLARIRYTTGDIKGDLADVPVDDLRLLRERGQRAQKGEREQ
jgi:hypothetical protein